MNENKYHILIVGAGQLGSRHLQALASSSLDLKISVVDPSSTSLAIAEERYAQVLQKTSSKDVGYFKSAEGIGDKDIDVCIVATSAKYRLIIMEKLLADLRIKNMILEKVLFQSEQQLNTARNLIQAAGVNTWVNCPRRMMDIYSILRTRCEGERIELTVSGVNWGLACNAIHWIDIWAFLAGEEKYTIDTSALSTKISDSKRPGYQELNGTIHGKHNGHSFVLSCNPGEDINVVVELKIAGQVIRISEGSGEANIYEYGELVESISFALPFQSQLTQLVVEEVILKGTSKLTTYSESALLHQPLLEGFLQHFNLYGAVEYTECPIT